MHAPDPAGSGRPQVGMRISTLAGIRDHSGPAGVGRTGCFAVRSGQRRWHQPLLVSNHHVLRAHGAEPGSAVYRMPSQELARPMRIEAAGLDPLGWVTGDGHDGVHRYAYPGEAELDYYVDCATARVSDEEARPAGPLAFAGVARVRDIDVLPARIATARLLGVHARASGRIVDVAATVEREDGSLCPNSIVIRSLPGRAPFASRGDSGALVTDRLGRAVGLLWGLDLADPAVAYACHLLPALDRLGVVVSPRASLHERRHREEP